MNIRSQHRIKHDTKLILEILFSISCTLLLTIWTPCVCKPWIWTHQLANSESGQLLFVIMNLDTRLANSEFGHLVFVNHEFEHPACLNPCHEEKADLRWIDFGGGLILEADGVFSVDLLNSLIHLGFAWCALVSLSPSLTTTFDTSCLIEMFYWDCCFAVHEFGNVPDTGIFF